MLKWIAGIAVGLVWCVIIFFVTWYLTFPSQAVVDRAAFEVQKASNGSYALKASSASPWRWPRPAWRSSNASASTPTTSS